jgi:hypothetical protein
MSTATGSSKRRKPRAWLSLVPVTSGASGKGAQTTQTVAPEGWYSLSAAAAAYTLTFALPVGWRATGPLTRTLVKGTAKQIVNLGVQPLVATAAPAAAPTPAPSVWQVTPVGGDCFDLTDTRTKQTYTLCIAAREMFRVTIKPTATMQP